MTQETKKIQFEGGELLGIKTKDGQVWLGVKKACLDIGLNENQARAEVKKVKESLLFENNWLDLRVKFDTQHRNTIVLNEKFIPSWLDQINLTPIMKNTNPKAVSRLLTYQLKVADTLHKAFFVTEEQKQELYNELGLHGEILDLKNKVSELSNSLSILIDIATINSRQAQKILTAGKERVNHLLGGAKSEKYKMEARTYFKNMWNQFAEKFEITTYKDLNPVHVKDGYNFLANWNYA